MIFRSNDIQRAKKPTTKAQSTKKQIDEDFEPSSSQSDEELDKIVEALFENETKKVAPPTKTAQTKTAPTKTAPTNAAPKKSVHPFPEKVPVLALPNPAEKWSQVETALLMLLNFWM